jgi:hypothetical protein
MIENTLQLKKGVNQIDTPGQEKADWTDKERYSRRRGKAD